MDFIDSSHLFNISDKIYFDFDHVLFVFKPNLKNVDLKLLDDIETNFKRFNVTTSTNYLGEQYPTAATWGYDLNELKEKNYFILCSQWFAANPFWFENLDKLNFNNVLEYQFYKGKKLELASKSCCHPKHIYFAALQVLSDFINALINCETELLTYNKKTGVLTLEAFPSMYKKVIKLHLVPPEESSLESYTQFINSFKEIKNYDLVNIIHLTKKLKRGIVPYELIIALLRYRGITGSYNIDFYRAFELIPTLWVNPWNSLTQVVINRFRNDLREYFLQPSALHRLLMQQSASYADYYERDLLEI